MLLSISIGLALTPQQALAQEACGLEARVPFAGHTLPLDGVLVEEDLAFENAFPNWSSGGLIQPIFMNFPPDGSNRLFFIERRGVVKSIPNRSDVVQGELTTVLDIQSSIDSDFTEEGLLGIAFHPLFAQNGLFFLHFTAAPSECALYPRCAQIVRYQIDSQNPDAVLPGSDFVVLEIERPGTIQHHNGGAIAFGEDGFLYIAVGDQDHKELPQDTSSLRGKLLRIDINSGTPFNPGIPSDNPFGNAVWHYGLRNPWRFSFDRENPSDLWIADVGSRDREEVNWLPGGTGGGLGLRLAPL